MPGIARFVAKRLRGGGILNDIPGSAKSKELLCNNLTSEMKLFKCGVTCIECSRRVFTTKYWDYCTTTDSKTKCETSRLKVFTSKELNDPAKLRIRKSGKNTAKDGKNFWNKQNTKQKISVFSKMCEFFLREKEEFPLLSRKGKKTLYVGGVEVTK